MNTFLRGRRFAFLPVITERNHIMLVAALSFLLGTLSIFHLTAGLWLWAVFALGIGLGLLCRRTGWALFLCLFAIHPGSLLAGFVCG